MLQFILGRYNYWIVIILMMTGLYIVFSRSNLVKKIIGLNIFQTSVFIFYITIGKISGGTAPIFIGGHADEGGHGDDSHHGANEGHGSEANHGETSHDDKTHGEDGHETFNDTNAHDLDGQLSIDHLNNNLQAKTDNPFADVSSENLSKLLADKSAEGLANHEASTNLPNNFGDTDQIEIAGKIANSVLTEAKAGLSSNHSFSLEIENETTKIAGDLAHSITNAPVTSEDSSNAHGAAHQTLDATSHGDVGPHSDAVIDVIYTNPLPHVLILTAIVVGVATTAVGLALAVRIREAYGTIEEDELEAADDIAEFGQSGSYKDAPELASGHISEEASS